MTIKPNRRSRNGVVWWLGEAALRTLLIGMVVAIITPAAAPAADAPKRCVGAEEASVHANAAGEDGPPPKFTPAFYRHLFTLDTSLDGIDGKELPISIEEVCEVPKKLRKQATQLAGSDGIALIRSGTTVWKNDEQLTGDAATDALAGADTAFIRVRMVRQPNWHKDEDGDRIPTFRAGRVEITD